jgi:hypothetical protein
MKYVDPRPVELVTPRLVLRNFVMEDVARVAEIANDPRVADTVLSIAMLCVCQSAAKLVITRPLPRFCANRIGSPD